MPILKPMHALLATSLLASCGTTNVPVADDAPMFPDVQASLDAAEAAPDDAALVRDAQASPDVMSSSRPYVDLNWTLRCPPPMTAGCAAGCTEGVDRIINGYAGEPGVNLSCSVTESATDRVISFTARNGSGQSLEFRNVQVPRVANSAVSGEVILTDGAEYRGAAGSGAPSTAQACQVSAMEFTIDPDTGDTRMRGQVLCETMRAAGDSTLCRGMTAAGARSPIPAQFDIFSCPGLNP